MEHGESRSHWKMDRTIMSTQWTTHPGAHGTTVSNPTLSRFDHRVNNPLLDWTTVGNPDLDQAVTFRSTHRVHVATTATTTKSPMNRSLSLSLSCDFDFCFFLCLYIEIFYNNICLDFEKMCETWWKCVFQRIFKNTAKHHKIFSKAFFGMQPNTWKFFPFWKIFSPKNILHLVNILHIAKCNLSLLVFLHSIDHDRPGMTWSFLSKLYHGNNF